MTLGEAIRDFREKNRLTMQDFADRAGLSKGAISMLEKNKRPGSDKRIAPTFDTYIKVSNAMQISLAELLELLGEDKVAPSANVLASGVSIPVLGRIAAGVPIEEIEEIIGYEEISEKLARTGEFFALKIKGRSMEPKIHDGDIVIVRKQETAENGEIVIANINGDEGTCKRVKFGKDGMMLISLNPDFDPIVFSAEDVASLPVTIIGRVVEARTSF